MKSINVISDIMKTDITCAPPQTPLSEVVQTMQSNKISSLLICKDKKAVGIITERDILKESLTPEISISKEASEVMSSPIATVQADMDYRDAYLLMSEKKFRHLVIEDAEGLAQGIVSESDFLNHLSAEQLLAFKRVENVMIKDVITARPSESVKNCLELMSKKSISTLVIQEGSRAIGVISERDALSFIQKNDNLLTKPISEVMRSPVSFIDSKESVIEAQERMREMQVRRLIVVDKAGNTLGIITRHDLIKNIPNYYIRLLKEKVQHQERLLDEKTIYQNSLNAIPHALIIATDRKGDVCFVKFNSEELHKELTIKKNVALESFDDALFSILKKEPYEERLKSKQSFSKIVKRGSANLMRYYKTSLSKILDDSENFQGYLYVAKEITKNCLREQKLRQSANVFENTNEGVMVTDTQGYIIDVNRAFSNITGYSKEKSLNKKASILRSGRHTKAFYQELWKSIQTKGKWQGEIYNRRKNGEIYPQWLNISSTLSPEGTIENYVAVFTDITQLKESQEKLNLAIHYDHLTKLPNKSLLKARLEHTLSVSKRQKTYVSVMFLNLDNFKKINDSYGHTLGDEVLIKVAQRISSLLREDDTLAHLGGDNFVIVMNHFKNPETINAMAQRIIDTFQESYYVSGESIWITASMGISIAPNDTDSSELLLKNADIAMYEAKSDGKNSFKYYNDKMTANVFERLLFENALKDAVDKREFEVYYQPQQDLNSDEIIGLEALIRWNHPTLGRIPPDKFIPIAEETKLIIGIGEFVLKQVCEDLNTWREAGIYNQRVAVNLSGIQIEHSDFISSLKSAIAKYDISPNMLEIEITESVVMSKPELWIESLNEIRALGIELSIDDFGTGYSSLSYLRSLPLNTLKIDMSFVRDLPHQKDACAIAKAIIAMGSSLGLTIIAEGVESNIQKEYLKSVGCHQLQGFLLATPMSKSDLEAWLLERK